MQRSIAEPERHARNWRIASWALLAAWLGCAALVMNRVRGGFVTNYGADLTQPGWLYIIARDLPGSARAFNGRQTKVSRNAGADAFAGFIPLIEAAFRSSGSPGIFVSSGSSKN
jgi:hypothetical protein